MFTNEIVLPENLPNYQSIDFKPIEKSYFKIIVFNFLLFPIVLAAGFTFLIVFNNLIFTEWFVIAIYSFLLLLLILGITLSYFGVKKRGYAFRTHDAVYRFGIINQSTFIVPYNRIQHVALHRGWLSQKLGLAKLELFTAGGSTSDLKIPGLPYEQAKVYKDMMVNKIKEINLETAIPLVTETQNIPEENQFLSELENTEICTNEN